MKTILAWVTALAETLGAPGLFLVAALDSSFLSLPQINDLLLVLSVAKRPHLMPLYATMSTLGSLAGCFVMYYIGRKGEDALIKRRFSGPRMARALALFNRFGMLAVLVPASMPSEPFQPKPMKVLLMALAAGLVLGAGGVLGREYLDRSVHDARGLRDEFELPVLAEIPRIDPAIG